MAGFLETLYYVKKPKPSSRGPVFFAVPVFPFLYYLALFCCLYLDFLLQSEEGKKGILLQHFAIL